MSIVYGYVVIDKDGKRAPTNRSCYDSKNAAANGFAHFTRRCGYYEEYRHLKGLKLSQQDQFRVVSLVASDE